MVVHEDTHGNRGLTKCGLTEAEGDAILARFALNDPHKQECARVILIRRTEVRPFTERQVELVNTFADQAVIAIENTRLFEEVQARTRELAKTVEDLEIASQHKNQFVANMSHELRTLLAAILQESRLCLPLGILISA